MEQRSVNDIRQEVKRNIGKEVILKADMGRKRIKTKTGVIVNAFPSVFTVKVNNDFDVERTVSYSYSDILTSTVELISAE
ncbi:MULTISPECIES: Veg family protein [unclassified Anaerococcus]|uniref:Veg family protein n=1 Tax=Anaerococcus martiniensis TaxID=3115615 RepID=A0ABW9M802_9FIRM|nr:MULTISPECIES: Veg family protein [unclassified Anaerococcus]MBM0046617.1 Veg family protein [Anaerococcus sp. mt242]